MADVKGDGARGPKRGLFGKLRDMVDRAATRIGQAFGVSAEDQGTSAKKPKRTRTADLPKGVDPQGPVPEVLKRALRQDLRRRIPDSWFTKKRTPGVVASYANTLREMGPNSRRWCRAWFGDERPYIAGKLRRARKLRRKERAAQ